MIDLSKISPAPWTWSGDADDPGIESGNGGCVLHIQMHGNINTVNRTGEQFSHADAEFVCLARQAFDVMVRRGWAAIQDIHGNFFVRGLCKGKWCHLGTPHPVDEWGNPHRIADPFTALVEADKWYRENVEGKPCVSE